ncbi:restriction endonuclease subunit S [Kingella negevensis]|uniref:restriction endonuclease subunit S n=1 Tax=Kingella negevensis TaxID=1522312 RepID=UPI00050A28FC|nr:restriction endonuclease subunit S [Kingella negevensis]
MQKQNILQKIQTASVEWKPLGEVTNYEQPSKYLVKSTDYKDEYSTPVLTAGKTFILGYTDETTGIYPASDNPVIIFDDFTTANKWVDFDFKAKSSAMKMITSADEEKYILKYIYYWLNTLPNEQSDNDHKRQWIGNYAKKLIPIPPLALQRKIVNLLDNFTELTAELTARKKQYQYYRDLLLDCENPKNPFAGSLQVEWKTLGETVEICRGKRLVRSQLDSESPFPVYQNSLQPLGFFNEKNCNANKTFVISAGAAGDIGFSYVDFWAADDCYYFECPENLNERFLYYILISQQKIIKNQVRKASVPRLGRVSIEKLKIPIPPLETQAKIVEILDKFDMLVNSISEGLPREIELRQKQYEYYREQLLNFSRV